jgi:death-on-curing protein
MIDIGFAIKVHEILINEFGGTHGIRDINGLKSALARPFASFDQKELYPSIFSKTAALLESLISNHPFIDGNKRVGYFLMRYFLLTNNFDLKASQTEKYEFVISIASGNMSFVAIAAWIEEKSKKID